MRVTFRLLQARAETVRTLATETGVTKTLHEGYTLDNLYVTGYGVVLISKHGSQHLLFSGTNREQFGYLSGLVTVLENIRYNIV